MRKVFLFLLICAVTMGSNALQAQTIVQVHEEPRHRLVHETPEFLVLDVLVAPGDTTLFHKHETPTTYIAINPVAVNVQDFGEKWLDRDSTHVPGWVAGGYSMNEEVAERPFTHRLTNLARSPFRVMAILNRGSGNPAADQSSLSPDIALAQEGKWFRIGTSSFEPAQALHWTQVGRPVIAVQVTEGIVSIETPDGATQVLDGAGAFVVLAPRQEYTFRNSDAGAVQIVLVEIR